MRGAWRGDDKQAPATRPATPSSALFIPCKTLTPISSECVVIAICRNSDTNERVYTKSVIARLVKNCGGAQAWDDRATGARWYDRPPRPTLNRRGAATP